MGHAGQFDPDCDDDNVSDGGSDPDAGGPITAGPDNCITTANTSQTNSDGDTMGDACDPDDDNDGDLDGADNCPTVANPSQANADGDSQGDACDLEDDGDGFSDADELAIGTNQLDPCGSPTGGPPVYSQSWPGDVFADPPVSHNRIDLQDIASFLAPTNRFNTSSGDPGFHIRWDVSPGTGGGSETINIIDMGRLLTVSPDMFGGNRAWNYGTPCTP
jgi:hypothetical protein